MPFSRPSMNILICMWIGYYIVKTRTHKWVLYTFVNGCFYGTCFYKCRWNECYRFLTFGGFTTPTFLDVIIRFTFFGIHFFKYDVRMPICYQFVPWPFLSLSDLFSLSLQSPLSVTRHRTARPDVSTDT